MRMWADFEYAWVGWLILLGWPGMVTAAPSSVTDTSGRIHSFPQDAGTRATVLVFLQPDCPISNQYAPVLNRLAEQFSDRKVRFFRVYPEKDSTVKEIEMHTQEYRYHMPAVLDPGHELVEMTGASVTPEVVVFNSIGHQVYRGRIDDRYVSFGKKRPNPQRHDLQLALEAVLAGRGPQVKVTPAVGCFISKKNSP